MRFCPAGAAAVAQQGKTATPLERQKLKAEIAKLDRETAKIDHEEDFVGDVVDSPP